MVSLYFHVLKTLKNGMIIFAIFACMVSSTSANNVIQSQKMLLNLGFNPGPADGIYGKKTQIALEEFYTSIADVFDGIVSANEIMDFDEDILRYLEGEEGDKYDTNKNYVGMKDLFRG